VWHKDLHLPFLFVLLEFLDINRFSAQTAQPLVTGSLLRSLEVPLPPGGEQEAIATYLREVLPPYESLQEEAEAAIGMLGELRSAVISAAVTGKIDVRGGAA
jgi:type I restriction enzyme S subunit